MLKLNQRHWMLFFLDKIKLVILFFKISKKTIKLLWWGNFACKDNKVITAWGVKLQGHYCPVQTLNNLLTNWKILFHHMQGLIILELRLFYY